MHLNIDTSSEATPELIAAWMLLGNLIESRDPSFFGKPAALASAGLDPNGPVLREVVQMSVDATAAEYGLTRREAAPPPQSTPAVPVAAVTAIPAATVPASSMATIAPMIPPPPGPPSVEIDSAGVQWSAALHSSTKSKTIDGRWKARVKRGANAIVPSVTTTSATMTAVSPPAQYHTGYVPPVAIPPPPVTPPPVVDDEADLEPDAPAATDFPTFISNITAAMNAGTVTQAKIAEVTGALGIDGIFSLNTVDPLRPDMLAQASRMFGFTA
jgi:hypothetical protein